MLQSLTGYLSFEDHQDAYWLDEDDQGVDLDAIIAELDWEQF